jgi:sugar-specific transcriptional regulator TrmB
LHEKALELKKVFSGLLPGFGINHARVYYCLLSSEVKTGKQVIEETKISQPIAYASLNDLLGFGLAKKTNTKPANYYSLDPIKTFYKLVKSHTKKHEKNLKKLENIILEDSENNVQKYMIEIGKGGQTKLISLLTKTEVRDKHELLQIKREFEKYSSEILKQQTGALRNLV